MSDSITARERLRSLTQETWSQQGSVFRAGPMNTTQADSVASSLADFEIEFERLNSARGAGFAVPVSETAKLAAIDKSDIKSYLSV